MGRFDGRVAIVTGAGSGIGLATARRLGSEGATVVIADVSPGDAEQDVLRAGAPAVWAATCDVSREHDVTSVAAGAVDRFGRVDVIVNNAGHMVFKPLEEHTLEDWLDVLRVDLLGAFLFTREAFRRMSSGGAVVNVSSIHAEETTPLVSSYAAAKAALLSLTRSAAIEGKARHIRVNAVLPGAIDTPMLWKNPNLRTGLEVISTADVGRPEDVAAVIAYLASEDACFVQGVGVRIDGGRLSRL